jgi:hypothetical protein
MSRLVAGVLGVTIVGSGAYAYSTRFDADLTVAGKSEQVLFDKGVTVSVPRFTDDQGNSYKMLPTPWFWHFKSNELWKGLEVGKQYHVKGYGIQNPTFYLSPNVYSVESISEKQEKV